MSPALLALIEAHRRADGSWVTAFDAAFGSGDPMLNQTEAEALAIEQESRQRLLAYRPVTLAEAQARIAYLIGPKGPFAGIVVGEDDVLTFMQSMLPLDPDEAGRLHIEGGADRLEVAA